MAPIKHPTTSISNCFDKVIQLPHRSSLLASTTAPPPQPQPQIRIVERVVSATAATIITNLAATASSETSAIAPTTAGITSGTVAAGSTITITSSKSSSSSTSSSSSGGGGGGGILAEAVATTHLSWWQLLAIILGGCLVLFTSIWLWFRHRKKKKRDKKAGEKRKADEKRKEEEKARELLAKALLDKEKRRGKESDTESESDDSISDGGTIRPSRTRRRRRGGRDRDRGRRRRGRKGRRRRSESESDWSSDSDDDYYSSEDESDDSYYARRLRGRRRYENRDRGGYRDRDRRYDRQPAATKPTITRKDFFTPPVPVIPKQHTQSNSIPKRKASASASDGATFRDSVFSSYNSMKKAAVRLKYVEAKVKLKKQLEEEEDLERKRRDKVKEANEEIEQYQKQQQQERQERERQKWFWERKDAAAEESQDSDQLLIPPVKRGTTHSSSSNGSGGIPTSLPIPPQRAISRDKETLLRGGSVDSQVAQRYDDERSQSHSSSLGSRQLYPPAKSQSSDNDTAAAAVPRPARPERKATEDSLSNEISHLLGNGGAGKNVTSQVQKHQGGDGRRNRPSKDKSLNDNLSHDHDRGGVSMPHTPRTSVYWPVTPPKMRPIIPKGGLTAAPPPKVKIKSSIPPSWPQQYGHRGIGLGAWIGAGLGFGQTDPIPAKSESIGSSGANVVPALTLVMGSVPPKGLVGSVSNSEDAGVRSEGGGGMAGVGARGSKWANRLRERR